MARSSTTESDRTIHDVTVLAWRTVEQVTRRPLRVAPMRDPMPSPRETGRVITRMAHLTPIDRHRVIEALINRHGIRGTVRRTGVARHVISALLCSVGTTCERLEQEWLREVHCRELRCEAHFGWWLKPRPPSAHGMSRGTRPSEWTWTCSDPATGLVVGWTTGPRTHPVALGLLACVARRLAHRAMVRLDDERIVIESVAYEDACREPLPGMLPGDVALRKRVKFRAALALFFTFHNLACLRPGDASTAAMAAGLTTRIWTLEDILGTDRSAARGAVHDERGTPPQAPRV